MEEGRTQGLERLEKAFWLPCWEKMLQVYAGGPKFSQTREAPSEKPSGREERRAASLLAVVTGRMGVIRSEQET